MPVVAPGTVAWAAGNAAQTTFGTNVWNGAYVSTPVCFSLSAANTLATTVYGSLPTASDAWGNSIVLGTGGAMVSVISNCG